MSIFAKLVAGLGETHGSARVQALLGELPVKKALRKEGGYRASLTFKREGIYLIFTWHRPDWVFGSAVLFPAGVEGFAEFAERIAGRVPISSSRPAVHAAFGTPSQVGGSGKPVGVLIDYSWDRYDLAEYHLRFDYEDADGAIRLVILMSKACARELNVDLQD